MGRRKSICYTCSHCPVCGKYKSTGGVTNCEYYMKNDVRNNMMDMNDIYVNDFCPTKVHCRGFVFTIGELVDIAICKLTHEELVEHLEKKNES